MFYKLIEKKRNEWLSSPECRVKALIHYIEQQGKMRDAQKTDLSNVVYKAKNRSFCEGRFVPKKRTALDGKVWWCAYDTLDGCYSKSPLHGKYKTKRSCEIGINWSIKEYNHHWQSLY